MISDYSSLKSAIESWLMRDDIDSATLVQLAESEFRVDHRLRKIEETTLVVTSDDFALGADFQAIESLRHDGSTYRHRIDVVDDGSIGRLRTELGATGAPYYAAIVNGALRFAPAPDASYDMKLLYWSKLESLSDSNPTNWLITDHPLIYLYGALKHSAPFLHDDERLATWQSLFEEQLEKRHAAQVRAQFSGHMRVRPRNVIG